MPNQAPTSSARTTRNSRGLRRARTDRESSVESIESVNSIDSAVSSRRAGKHRARRARSNTPDAADIHTSSSASTSNLPTTPPEPSATEPCLATRDTALATLTPIREEDPQPASHQAPLANAVTTGLDESTELTGSAEAQSTPDLEEETAEEDLLPYETDRFTSRRRQEGHQFGGQLYAAIKAEQFVKNCLCPHPTIHRTKTEAEAGTGVFRFYQVGARSDNIRVFMRKGDNHWHCQCYAQYSRYADITRKRKAEDSEIDVEAGTSREDTRTGITTVRVVDDKNDTENPQPQISIRPMWSAITGRVENMSASVKRWFSRLGARLTGVAYEALETRKYDATGKHLVVKRFKRQYCVPVGPDPADKEEVPFDELPYFDWANNAAKNIGETTVRCIKDALWRQVIDIRRGFISFDTSVDALRARHKDGEYDLELSMAIHNLMTKHFEEATVANYIKAADMYEQGAGLAVSYMNMVYLHSELLPVLKRNFAKPPKRLDYFGDFEFKMRTRQAGDFLTWLLTQKALFNINGDYQLAITKMIVDIDAVHKQEILPSLVEFPGNNADIMPGSFPLEENILEEVPAGDFIIEPVYECKHPDSRPSTSGSSSSAKLEAPETKNSDASTPTPIRPRGILKKKTKKWPDAPTSPEPGDMASPSRVRKLQFRSPVAFFTPPKRSPKRRTYRERSAIGKTPTKLPTQLYKLSAYRELVMELYAPAIDLSYQGTKYGEFLDEARRELEAQPGFKRPPSPPTASELAKKEEAMRKSREAMTPEERRHEMDLFVRDLELDLNGEVVRRKLLVPEAELMIATRQLEDIDLTRQLRNELEEAAERERQKMAQLLAEERRLRIEEEKRKEEEEKRRRVEEERRQKEAERLKRAEELRVEQEAQRLREAEERATRTKLRAPTRAIVGPITEEWQTKVMGIATTNPTVELTKTLDGQALTRRDFEEKLLPATAWLNDNIITGSILYVGEYVNSKAGTTVQDPKCATFTSYFWPRLESAGPSKCGRLMRRAGVRKNNFLDIESILIPICSGSHWTLAVVLPGRRIVAHMDSLRAGHGNPNVTKRILEWVKVTLEEEFVEADWQVLDLDAPLQRNGWDCGVFTITNGLCLALGIDPSESYTAGQLTLQRHRLAAMLLNGGFKGDFDLDGV